ncbi:MAG: hypothetical protein ACRDJ4_06040 [Actinomycetota bacterium]
MIKDLFGKFRTMVMEPHSGDESLQGEAEAELQDAQERTRHELGEHLHEAGSSAPPTRAA